jgi:endonuclease G
LFSTEVYLPKNNKVLRTNDFHSDKRIVNGPTPEDYIGTGYDRGHLTPAGDSTTEVSMSDTFLMTNMTPQLPSVNRASWNELEMHVRNDLKYKYIITGAVYSYPAKTIGTHKIPVPVSYYKIVYLADGSKKVFEAQNSPNAKVVESDLETVKSKAKINFK